VKHSRLLWLVAILIGFVFLTLAARRLRIEDVAAALAHARLWPWLPLGIASYVLGHVLRGIRLRRLVRRETLLETADATNIVVVGYAVNNILPARLGEVARAWMLMERSGLSFVQTVTITATERLLDALALLIWLGVATALLPGGPLQAVALRIVVALVIAGLLLLAIGVLFPAQVLGLASRLASRWTPSVQDGVLRRVHAVLNGLTALRGPRSALSVAALTALVWLCEGGLYVALLPAFGLDMRPVHGLFAMATTNIGILVPSTPGFVGPFHFFCSQAMAAIGVAQDVSLAYAVLVHAAFFVPITIWGVGVLAAYGLSVGATLRLSRTAEPLLSPDTLMRPDIGIPETPPSRFHLALTEAAIPLESAFPPGEERDRVRHEVATFVAGQLEQLPVRLRVAFALGLLGFRAITRLRYGRGFCDLPVAPRRAWFEAWAYGRWSLGRQLFRAVRSTALLAWYELPAARAALAREPVSVVIAEGSR
jgi:uncharacterized protein (TIRG00374 family)